MGFDTHGLSPTRTRCPMPPLLFGRNAIRDLQTSDASLRPAIGNGSSGFKPGAKASDLPHSGRLPTALSSFGEQDWETDKCRTEAGSSSFDRIAFETKTGSSLGPRRWTPGCVSGCRKYRSNGVISPNNDIQVRLYLSDLHPACANSYFRPSQSIHPS